MKENLPRILAVVLLLIGFNAFYTYMAGNRVADPIAAISYSQFKQQLENGQIAEVTLQGDMISGRYTKAIKLALQPPQGETKTGEQSYKGFTTLRPPVNDPSLLPQLEKQKVQLNVLPPKGTSIWNTVIVSLLPWVLIIAIWWFVFQRMRQQGGMGGVLNKFAKSGATLYSREQSKITFEDVAGLAEEKQELREIIDYLRDPDKFARLGGRVPRGVMLAGPPGTGKTLLARAIAGEAEVPFFSISASQFIEMFVGVGASRVRDLFTNAKKNAPSIIFVDEIDAVGRARGTGLGGGHDEREQTLNQLLSELDGFNPHDEVIVLAATNRPDVLDPALLRPGRFDRQVIIGRPDWRDRVKILQVHTRRIPLAENVNLTEIAKGTPGMVGADIQSLVNEAALVAAREDADKVAMSHLEKAKDRQLMGMERKLFMSELERRITATHEAGHALVASCLPNSDPVYKITIIPRGQALGLTQQLPVDDRYHYPRSYLLGRMCVMLGGRNAEREFFGESSSGAQNDLKQVMDVAEKMVCQWGMSDKLGSLSYPRGEEHPFLGRKLASEKNFSDKTAWIIDQEIKKLVDLAEECAMEIISANREILEELAALLLEEESLDHEQYEQFIAEHKLVLPPGPCTGIGHQPIDETQS